MVDTKILRKELKKHLKVKGGLSEEQALLAVKHFDSGVAQGKDGENLFVDMVENYSSGEYGLVALTHIKCQLQQEEEMRKQGQQAKAGIIDNWIESKLAKINERRMENKPYEPLKNLMTDAEYEMAIRKLHKLPNGLELEASKAHTAKASTKKFGKLDIEIRF